jgi:hypothetical protein
MADQTAAEDIVDALYEMQHVDCYDLARYAFDQLSERDRAKFVDQIKDEYDLLDGDQAVEQAREAIASDREH